VLHATSIRRYCSVPLSKNYFLAVFSEGFQRDVNHYRVFRNFSVVVLYTLTSSVSSVEPCDFYLFGPRKKHLAGKKFAADADVKQAVTWLQTFNTYLFYIQAYKPWCRGRASA